MSPAAMKRALVAAARESVRLGLNQGTSGNLSVRTAGGMLITPSGHPCDAIRATDLVAVGELGRVAPGRARPSSEWRLHRDIYEARPDVGAIVHAHPVFATTLACLRLDLPAVHYQLAAAGTGVVRCAPYTTFGTAALSKAAVRALGGAGACLLANHGLVAVGPDPVEALRVAVEVERVAELYWRARAIGEPVILTAREMAAVHRQFHGYGRPGRG